MFYHLGMRKNSKLAENQKMYQHVPMVGLEKFLPRYARAIASAKLAGAFRPAALPSNPCYEHIAALDVTMHDSKLVNMFQGHAELRHPVLHFTHWQLQVIPHSCFETTKHQTANSS